MLITYVPSGPLSRCVDKIWFASRDATPHERELSLPTGRADIVIPLLQDSLMRFDSIGADAPTHFRGGIVSGAHDRFAVRGTAHASMVIGVHFRPGGAATLFGEPFGQLRNRTVLLDALWGPTARDLRERLQSARLLSRRFQIMEEVLLARFGAAPPADPLVVQALRELQRDPTVARTGAIQRASNCSPAQFIRRFSAAVGLTPKRYARVLRFNDVLARVCRAGPREWAEVAADAGYCDQSHLIQEFRRFAGMTPGTWKPLSTTQPTHVPIVGPGNGAKISPIQGSSTPVA